MAIKNRNFDRSNYSSQDMSGLKNLNDPTVDLLSRIWEESWETSPNPSIAPLSTTWHSAYFQELTKTILDLDSATAQIKNVLYQFGSSSIGYSNSGESLQATIIDIANQFDGLKTKIELIYNLADTFSASSSSNFAAYYNASGAAVSGIAYRMFEGGIPYPISAPLMSDMIPVLESGVSGMASLLYGTTYSGTGLYYRGASVDEQVKQQTLEKTDILKDADTILTNIGSVIAKMGLKSGIPVSDDEGILNDFLKYKGYASSLNTLTRAADITSEFNDIATINNLMDIASKIGSSITGKSFYGDYTRLDNPGSSHEARLKGLEVILVQLASILTTGNPVLSKYGEWTYYKDGTTADSNGYLTINIPDPFSGSYYSFICWPMAVNNVKTVTPTSDISYGFTYTAASTKDNCYSGAMTVRAYRFGGTETDGVANRWNEIYKVGWLAVKTSIEF